LETEQQRVEIQAPLRTHHPVGCTSNSN